MKNLVSKIAATLFILSAPAVASDMNIYNSSSLIAIEGSYSTFDIENDDTPAFSDKEKFSGVGIKLGAQTNNYRLFLSARNNYIDGYDFAYSYGAELQHLINLSKLANLFIGVNGGIINLEFDDSQDNPRKINSTYIGADIGTTLHITDTFDLELGARVSFLTDDVNTQNGVEYKLGYVSSGYASIIIKYEID